MSVYYVPIFELEDGGVGRHFQQESIKDCEAFFRLRVKLGLKDMRYYIERVETTYVIPIFELEDGGVGRHFQQESIRDCEAFFRLRVKLGLKDMRYYIERVETTYVTPITKPNGTTGQ